MAKGNHDGSWRRGRASMRRAMRDLAQGAVDGLYRPEDRLSDAQRRRADGLTERIAAEVEQLAEHELEDTPQREPALRVALGAAATLFEQHPLAAGELIALDFNPDRAADALIAEGRPTLSEIGAAAAELCRERILPLVVQELLTDQGLITELANSTEEESRMVNAKVLVTIEGHDGAVASAVFSLDGGTVLTSSEDATARLWNAGDGQQQHVLEGHDGPLWSATYSADGSRIATASHDQTARLWNTANGQLLLTLAGHEDWVRSAALSSDGTKLVTASYDTTARLWNAATGAPGLVLQHPQRVADAAFSADDGRIVTACYDTIARIWDATTGQELLALAGHEREVVSVAFSPDGTRVVTGSHDLTARLWDAADGSHLLTLTGHSGQVRSAAFSPDGTMIVTASDDHSARLWDAATGDLLVSLEEHTDWVFSAAFSPDGSRVVTASADRTAKVWDCAVTETRRVLVGSRGDMTIPTDFRTALGIEIGDMVVVELGRDALHVRPSASG